MLDRLEQINILKYSLERIKESPPIEEVYIKGCAMGEFYCKECNSEFEHKNDEYHEYSCMYLNTISNLENWINALEQS